MRIAKLIRTKLTSVVATGALVASAFVATALVAPSASADPPPIASITPEQVTADALPTVQIDGVVWDQAVVGNTVYAGGQFTKARPAGSAPGVNTVGRTNLLSYNLSTGVLNTAFNPTINGIVYTIAPSPDGSRIYVGGNFTNVNGTSRYRIAAVDATTGALITTFNAGVDYNVKTIVATNTTVYVGGLFSKSGSATRSRLAAFSATTGALLGWAPSADFNVNAMTISPDGKIIVGGAFQNINGSPAYGLAALDPVSGALIPWLAGNTIRNAGVNSAILSLTTDGTAIYGSGYHFGDGGNLEGTFSAKPDTGEINWVEDCHGDTYDAFSTGAAVYTASHAHYCGNLNGFPQSEPWSINMRRALGFTVESTGTLGHDQHGYFDWYGTKSPSMINWFPYLEAGKYTGKTQAAWTVTGNSQYVVMGGEFPSVNGVGQQGLVRFAVSSLAPNKQGPEYVGSAFNPSIISLPSGSARIAWQANSDKDDNNLTYTLTRDNVVVYQADQKSTFWNRPTMGFIDSTVVPGTLYRYRLTASDKNGNIGQSDIVNFTASAAGGSSAYAKLVIADGAAPYWPMNEPTGTQLLDNAGFNDGDITTGATRGVTPGAITGDAATTFAGSTTGSTRTAITGPNTYTAQVWIKTTTTSGGKILGFGGSNTGNSSSYDRHIYMDNDGRIWFGVYPNGVATVNSSSTYNDGQWHQITTSLGADGMKLYVDAKLVGSRADVTYGQDYQGYWRVGGDNIGGWPNQPASNTFAGSIDEVAIYPTVLTRQVIDHQWVVSGRTSTIPAAPADAYGAAVFNDNPLFFWRLGESSGTAAADSSQNADQPGVYHEGVTLGAIGGIKGTTNTAANFDGSTGLVSSANSFNDPKVYSLEAWFKTNTTNGGKIIGFGNSATGTSNNYDRHVYMSNDGKLYFGTYVNGLYIAQSNTAYNDNVWHHVVATQGADGMKLYVDGAQVGSNPQTAAQSYTGYWRVGGDNHWGCCSPFINSVIDDAAVYSSVLSPTQVANHFNLGNTVVAANQVPVASFTSSSTYLDATFDATASVDPDGTIASYAWNFGDNTSGQGATPAHTYAAAGSYSVTLTVTDNAGETNVLTNPVTVTAPPANVAPIATFSVETSVMTASVDASSSVDSDGTIAGYAWDFGDGFTTTGATASHTYTAAGTFTITLVVTDNDGATGTTTQAVSPNGPVNQAPISSFTVSASQLTASVDAAGSTDPDGTIASYAWAFGDGATATGPTASHTFSTPGMKSITLTVTDNQGATNTSTQPVEVTAPPVNSPPTAAFTHLENGLTTNVESTSTDVAPGTITSWAWTFGDGGSASTAAASHEYSAGGDYLVTLVVTDDNGATATVTATVSVAAPPVENVPPTADFNSSSAGLTASVDGSGSTDADGSIAAYSWNFGDDGTDLVTTPTATHEYAAAGTYQVTLTVTDNKGETNSITKSVTVSAPVVTPLVSDLFSRTSSNGWGTADIGGAWAIAGGASNFGVNAGTGKMTMSTPGAGPSATLPAIASPNLDSVVSVAFNKAASGGGTYVSVSLRKVGNTEYRVTPRLTNTGSIQMQLVKIVLGKSTVLQTVNLTTFGYAANDVMNIRFQTIGTTSVVLNAKVWKATGTEPAAWQATYTDSNAPLTSNGGLMLYSYLSGSSTSGAVVATFDNLKVVAVSP